MNLRIGKRCAFFLKKAWKVLRSGPSLRLQRFGFSTKPKQMAHKTYVAILPPYFFVISHTPQSFYTPGWVSISPRIYRRACLAEVKRV